MDIDIDVIINETYLDFVEDDTRYQIFYGGSSSGKSFFLAQRVVLDIVQGNRNYLIVRQVQNTIKKSVFNEITKAISNMQLTKVFAINRSDLVITCKPNGMQILFSGLDDSEKIKSITPQKGVITDIWVEEATETEYKDIKQLDKRLRGRSEVSKRMILSFNPVLKSHWIYQEYFNNWDETKNLYQDDNMFILKTTYKDNDFLEADDIKALEDETDKYYYDVYTCGNWGILGAVIFKNWSVEDLSNIRITADKFKNGLDFGFAKDPAALVHTYYDKTRKTIYILDEFYMTELTNDILAKEIFKRIEYQYITCDSAEPKSIKELKNHDISALPAKKGKDSINFGIQWLQQQKIVVDIKCHNMKNELQQYKWKEDRQGNVLPVPVDKNNHLIDALRYAYEDEFIQLRGPIKLINM